MINCWNNFAEYIRESSISQSKCHIFDEFCWVFIFLISSFFCPFLVQPTVSNLKNIWSSTSQDTEEKLEPGFLCPQLFLRNDANYSYIIKIIVDKSFHQFPSKINDELFAACLCVVKAFLEIKDKKGRVSTAWKSNNDILLNWTDDFSGNWTLHVGIFL